MPGTVYENMVLMDTSAVIALHDPFEQFHDAAVEFFGTDQVFLWLAVNTTSHETFTRARYTRGLTEGLRYFDFLRSGKIKCLSFDSEDEKNARQLLAKYKDQKLSFHDALCASVMKREGIFRVFTFDKHFWLFGFEILPGVTH
jgi:predicted nucleic acid-binding protein